MSAHRHLIRCMGTVFSLDIREPGVARAALTDAEQFLHWADSTFSTYLATSEVSRINDGTLTPDTASVPVRQLLALAQEYSVRTEGYFSPYPRSDGGLDLNGIVKGWAVEKVSSLLVAAGSRHHCVNGAGDVRAVGGSAVGEPWRIGVADPRNSQQIIATVTGFDVAVATSGSAERGNHISDPHTGAPAQGLLCVTVVGTNLTEADVLATAAFARGSSGPKWLATQPGHSAVSVDEHGAVELQHGAELRSASVRRWP